MNSENQPNITQPETIIINQLLSQEAVTQNAINSALELVVNFEDLSEEEKTHLLETSQSIQEQKASLKFAWQVLNHPKIKGKPRPWAFMGGAYVEADSAAMKSMVVLVYKIAQRRITSITGGGPGIMTASKESEKYELPGISVVLNGLSSEQQSNDTELKINLSDFGIRQTLIMDIADVHIFYPGGMGTDFEIKETQTKTKTNKWNRPKLIILFDDVNSDPHWNLLHEQNLLYVKEGLLRFDSRNSKKHIFKELGYSEVIENIINISNPGSTLTEDQILLIARNYNKDIKAIREILLETIYLRLKFGQEQVAVDEATNRGFIIEPNINTISEFRNGYISTNSL